MKTSMVERIGRAIAAADQEDYMEDCARYDARAIAAIKEIVEPTDKMIEAGEAVQGKCLLWSLEPGEGLDEFDPEPAWRAMAKAALG